MLAVMHTCHAMPCQLAKSFFFFLHAMLCHTMPCYATPCHAWLAISCNTIAYCHHASPAMPGMTSSNCQGSSGWGYGYCLDVSQQQLARLLVEQHCHLSLLVRVSRHHKPLYCGRRRRGAKGWQLGFDGPGDPAVPGPHVLLLLGLQSCESIATTCSTLSY